MSAQTEAGKNTMDWSSWLSWIGIVVALIGFFLYAPIWLGIIGAILGIISLWGTDKMWAWISIVVGVIVLILALVDVTVASTMMM